MSARTANHDENVLMGWPLGARKQAEIAAALNKAHTEKATHVVGCWCAETGFALLVEIGEGNPIHWHCTGPVTKEQARTWFAGMEKANREEQVGMLM